MGFRVEGLGFNLGFSAVGVYLEQVTVSFYRGNRPTLLGKSGLEAQSLSQRLNSVACVVL